MKKENVKALIKVSVIVAITIVFAFYFWQTKPGAIMDDALLDHSNPKYLMDQEAKRLKSEGFVTGETIPFTIRLDKLDRSSLLKVAKFTDQLKEKFPQYGIMSLSTAANYHDTGHELLSAPYINQDFLEQLNNSPELLEKWRQDIQRDPGVYGLLINRQLNLATVIMMLPEDCDETEMFHQVAEFLEEKKTSKLAWFLKQSIHVSNNFDGILVSGWVIARGLMSAALNANILLLSTIGLCITWCCACLNFRSIRQATIGSASIVLGLVWTTGSIGVLQAMGFELYMRVYILLVYTAIIVAQVSFSTKLFETYNELRLKNQDLPAKVIWKMTLPIMWPISLVALIAFANFSTLGQIQIRGILEVGIFSSLGIIYLLLISFFFIPALHILIGGEARPSEDGKLTKLWHGLLESITNWCYQFCLHKQAQARALTIVIISVVLAVALVGLDYMPGAEAFSKITGSTPGTKFLKISTKPIEYLKGSVIDKASILLNKPGNPGFDRVFFLVRPQLASGTSLAIDNPKFLAEVERFKQTVRTLNGAREVNTPVDTISVISRELFHLPLVRLEQQAHEAFLQFESNLDPLIKEQVWYNGGVTLSVSTSADDSVELGRLIDSVLKLGKDSFPDLKVITFGKLNLYPEADNYIKLGKPINVLTSQWISFLIYGAYIFWSNWKKRNVIRSLQLSWWRGGLVMSVPFIFAISVITLVMIACRVPLDQATACISALAINAAADFGLYLVYNYNNCLIKGATTSEALHFALKENGHMIVADNLLNSVCFMTLMFSSFIPIIRLGWIMVVMLFACGFGALVLMPALLPWAVRRN